MELGTVLVILFLHWFGDFFLQSDWMALNKSKNTDALFFHTGVYSLCFIPFGFQFYLATWAQHTVVDAVTSRITAKLWQQNKRHWFFVMVGLDQLIHYACLFGTYVYLFGA